MRTCDELTGTGVYYQAFMLAPASWRRLASWICGWLYVVGNITITLAVNFGSTTFFVACINVFEKEDGSPIFPAEPYQVFLIFLGITLLANAVSAFGNKWLPILDVSVPCLTPAGLPCADAARLPPSSGPLPASSPSSSPSSCSPRAAATRASTFSGTSKPNLAGPTAGPSAWVFSTAGTRPRRLA